MNEFERARSIAHGLAADLARKHHDELARLVRATDVWTALAEPLAEQRETRGHVTIEGTRRSPAWQMVQRAASVVVREAGF